jgi:hypothetical protein
VPTGLLTETGARRVARAALERPRSVEEDPLVSSLPQAQRPRKAPMAPWTSGAVAAVASTRHLLCWLERFLVSVRHGQLGARAALHATSHVVCVAATSRDTALDANVVRWRYSVAGLAIPDHVPANHALKRCVDVLNIIGRPSLRDHREHLVGLPLMVHRLLSHCAQHRLLQSPRCGPSEREVDVRNRSHQIQHPRMQRLGAQPGQA